jgi:cytochrome c oxidase subunit 2
MAPMAATLVNDAAVENVIAHIQTFPDNPAPATIEGNVENGKDSYTVCAYCHGADGMGVQAMNAPRLAGMTDWYVERQLHLFRDGVRGTHPTDFYGFQMSFMAKALRDDQAVKDLVAYINTL